MPGSGRRKTEAMGVAWCGRGRWAASALLHMRRTDTLPAHLPRLPTAWFSILRLRLWDASCSGCWLSVLELVRVEVTPRGD